MILRPYFADYQFIVKFVTSAIVLPPDSNPMNHYHTIMRNLLISICLLSAFTALGWDTPTMGWSSWNTYRNNISDSLIRQQALTMSLSGLKDVGYTYINIDDGAFDGRDAQGNLNINLARFPDGMKPLVEYIHSLGLKAGTYSDAGRNTCASFYDNDNGGEGTGLYGHDRQDLNFLFNTLGFDFIKVDFCGGDPAQNSEELDLDEPQRYAEIRAAIDSTGRTDACFNVCRWNYPGTWVEDVASSWRISGDINLSWKSVKDIIAQNLYLSAYASRGRFNDMDMLEVGRGLPAEEDKTHFGIWCIMSSPLLIGCDLTTLTDESLALLTNPELIALNQDPLALQGYVAQTSGPAYVLVKDILEPYSLTRAIAVYNPADTAETVTVDFNSLDLTGPVKARDVFSRTDAGTFENRMEVAVPAHGTRIFTLEAGSRLERKRYEAETARLSAYQEIMNNRAVGSAIYEPSEQCSGGMKASWLGGRPDNDIVWNNVYSQEGGEYDLTVAWLPGDKGGFTVDVNGTPVYEQTPASGNDGKVNNDGKWEIVGLNISLKPGENIIRLHNDTAPMPDIDYIDVVPRANAQ